MVLTEQAGMARTERTDEEEAAIHALPESSDEEDDPSTTRNIAASLPTPEPTQQSSSRQKRRPLSEANTNAARRSKRHKPTDSDTAALVDNSTEHKDSDLQLPSASQASSEPLWLSQSSQNTRKRKMYSKKATAKFVSTPEEEPELETGRPLDLNVPDDLSPERPKRNGAKLKSISDIGSSPVRSQKTKKSLAFMSSSPPEARALSQNLLLPTAIPENDDNLEDDFEQRIFKTHDRTRRGSSSSLSSIDSNVDIEIDASTRAKLNAGEDEVAQIAMESNNMICPKCKAKITLDECRDMDLDPNVRHRSAIEQQKFCFKHREATAINRWKEAGYPELDFAALGGSSRVQQHLTELAEIVKRKRMSFYLTKLDEAIAAARGVKGAVKRYFEVDTLDLINQGYYGPKGVEVLSRTIVETSTIIKEFKKRVRTDKAVQMAGVGRYIDCVLVPEMLVRLVQEDNDCNEEAARKILEDTQELGLLLCREDDHVDEQETQDFS